MAYNDYAISFNGRRITHPGGYDHIDATGMVVSTSGSLNLPIMIGSADTGKSGEVKWFTSPESARKYLSGGDLATAVELMFSPLPEGGGGASVVGVVIANQTVKAGLTSGNIVQSAKQYGEIGNRIQTKVETGAIPGTFKFTAQRWDTEEIEVFDKLGAVINLMYTGPDAYAAFSVTQDGVSGKAILLEIKTGADLVSATVDVSLDLTSERFSTVGSVVSYLTSISGYSASYVNFDNATMESSQFDIATNVDIKSVSGYVKAVKGDIMTQVNAYSALVEITDITDVPTVYGYTYLIGGSKGVVPESWAPHFNLLKQQFSDILVVLSQSPVIQAEALAHIQEMELRNQKQVLFTGGAVGETVQQIKQRATMLNSSRAVLGYPGIYHKSVGKGDQVLPSYMTGAMLAGRACGVGASEPITFDYFNVLGLEHNLLAGDPDIDELISAGVSVLEKTPNAQSGSVRLAQSITTYQGPGNTLFRELSVRRGADALSEKMRRTLEERFVGKKGVKATPTTVKSCATEILDAAVASGDIVDYRNIVVVFEGTKVFVDYEVAPTEPINFVLVTSHFVSDIK